MSERRVETRVESKATRNVAHHREAHTRRNLEGVRPAILWCVEMVDRSWVRSVAGPAAGPSVELMGREYKACYGVWSIAGYRASYISTVTVQCRR